MNKKWAVFWLTLIFSLFLAMDVYALHKSNSILLISSEIVIVFLYILTIWILLRSLRPLGTISRSLNLLREGDFSITMKKTGNDQVDAIIEVYNSMISRLREERLSVREKNQFLDLLIESSPLGILMLDLDGKITDANKAADRTLSLSGTQYKGKSLDEIESPLAKELDRITYDEKKLVVLKDGGKFLCRKLFFMDHGFKHPFYIIEEFTEEIRQAEREAYGKLIRMMAHEVNNTIGAVNSIMESIRSASDSISSADADEIYRMMGIAIQRNYQMNRFMQNFANVVKLPLPDKELISLNKSVRVVVDSFGSLFTGKNITTNLKLSAEEPMISADRSQIEQVLANIIKNSVEAVDTGGSISISTGNRPVHVCIEDDGTGLSEEAIGKIFTPFFTTKSGGQGIGLTLVQEILKNHGFNFRFRNREEGGTEFLIIFSNN